MSSSPTQASSLREPSPKVELSPVKLENPEPLDQPEEPAAPVRPEPVGQPVPPQQPETLPIASPEAVNFLASLGLDDMRMIKFTDSLVTISGTGKELGEFTIVVQSTWYAGLRSLHLQANSHGSIDNIPCGTSISAYLSSNLETLEQDQHEYVKLKDQPLVKKMSIKRENDGYVMTKEVKIGENVKIKTFTFSLEEMSGFVSEASNLILLRILARRNKVPDDMVFLSFDTEMKLSTSTYLNLGPRTMKVAKEEREVLDIERTIHSEENGPMSWQCSFLPDGHLAGRVQVGSPITIMLTHLPQVRETDKEEPKPVFEKKPLDWKQDMQLYFKFIDRTEELKADYNTYLRHHPDLRYLLADFLQFLLLRKPQDVLAFAAEYFGSFSTLNTEQTPFLTSNKSSAFKEP
uniref:ciliogenesis-associated TTC17-interacting protein n=1 Tax=Pristiophorus japonicus TaxID=55135 RepID=UPI00398ECB13